VETPIYDKGSLQAAFQDIVAESGAAQQKAEAEIKDQIRGKYGEFLGAGAKASELVEIESSYDEFLKLPASAREDRAKKIIEEFKKLDGAKTPINPRFPNASATENVVYLYSVARLESRPDVRKNLTAAFKAANQ